MALPIDYSGVHSDSIGFVLTRTLARLHDAQFAKRAATEQAAAADRDRADALARAHALAGQLDHLASMLAGRERYIAVLQGRWRRVRAGRTPRQRLARLWRTAARWLGRRWAVVAILLAALLLLPHVVGR